MGALKGELKATLCNYRTIVHNLSGPVSRDIAIVSLRYPLSRDTFSAIPAIPKKGAIPPLGALFDTDISVRYPILQHIARYLCDTPGKQARTSFAILLLKVARDMKSIAAGPLSPQLCTFVAFLSPFLRGTFIAK